MDSVLAAIPAFRPCQAPDVDPSRLVRWSPSINLLPSRSCFNACEYCGFRRDPGTTTDLSLAGAGRSLRRRLDSTEVLLLSGEVAPASPQRAGWFSRLLAFSRLALELERLHKAAPSKRLALRIGQLEQAGRLGVPFTTGLLLAALQKHWGHLQGVILQPWRPDGAQAGPLGRPEQQDLLELIEAARRILPAQVNLQLPPNPLAAGELAPGS